MRIHHLNCGTMCPYGGHLMDGVSSGFGSSRLVCHCLLIETEQGLVLVDTGFGREDVRHRHRRIAEFFLLLNRPRLIEQETARYQIERLGFKADDVRHIVLTHLDFDHAGGISDFPKAKVHLLDAEFRAAMHPDTLLDIGRFRPAQWSRAKQWKRYSVGGERWFGFDCVHDLEGLPPEILLIPLVGHTWGHCGVAVDTGEGWILHAGDAYFYRDEMLPLRPTCTPGLKAYQKMMEVDRRSRLWNQDRLRQLILHQPTVTVFSAHDRREFYEAKTTGRVTHVPRARGRRGVVEIGGVEPGFPREGMPRFAEEQMTLESPLSPLSDIDRTTRP